MKQTFFFLAVVIRAELIGVLFDDFGVLLLPRPGVVANFSRSSVRRSSSSASYKRQTLLEFSGSEQFDIPLTAATREEYVHKACSTLRISLWISLVILLFAAALAVTIYNPWISCSRNAKKWKRS